MKDGERYFCDTSALYGQLPRDLLWTLAQAGLVELRWGGYVAAELRRVLLRRRGADAERVDLLLTRMRAAVPGAWHEGGDVAVEGSAFPDPGDVPVVATALGAGCAAVVTENPKHFPATALEPLGLRVVGVDACLGEVVAADAAGVAVVIDVWLGERERPRYTRRTLLARLRSERAGLASFAAGLAAAWGEPT